jgi:hypothetical protein
LYFRIQEALAQNALPHHASRAEKQNIHGINTRERGYHEIFHSAQAIPPEAFRRVCRGVALSVLEIVEDLILVARSHEMNLAE